MDTRRAKYACTTCGSKFTTFSDLSKHRHIHGNPNKSEDDSSSHEDDDDIWQNDGKSSDTESDYEFLPLNNKQKSNRDTSINKEGDDVILVKEASPNDLTCNWCFDVFDNVEDLKAHVKQHSTMSTVKAESREEEYDSLDDNSSTKENEDKGQSSAKSIEKEEQHEEVEEPDQTSLCFYCPEPVQSVDHISIHFSVVDKKRFACHFCLKRFGMKKYLLMQHIRSCHSTQCYLCRKRLSTRANLLSHLRDKHGGGLNVKKPPPYQYCTICYKIVDEDVATHKAKEHTKQCSLCLKVFKSPEIFQDHMKYVHETELRCDKCGIRLSGMVTYKNHMKYHDPLAKDKCERRRQREKNAPQVKCQICSKMVSTVRMHKHKARHNSEMIVCNICGTRVKAIDVRTHMYMEHKPLKCPICDGEYIGYRRMNACRANHNRKFKCDVCGKDYSRKEGLVVHQRLHTGEKPFPCTECDRRFYTMEILYKHMLSHGIDTRANKKRVPSLVLSSEGPSGS